LDHGRAAPELLSDAPYRESCGVGGGDRGAALPRAGEHLLAGVFDQFCVSPGVGQSVSHRPGHG
jgi:hypothetical protein